MVATLRGRHRPRATVRIGAAELARLADQPALVHQGYLITGTAAAPRALSLRCTHLGCNVNLDRGAGELLCPCHGSRFALDGRVLAGPASKELFSVPMRRDGDDWVVDG